MTTFSYEQIIDRRDLTETEEQATVRRRAEEQAEEQAAENQKRREALEDALDSVGEETRKKQEQQAEEMEGYYEQLRRLRAIQEVLTVDPSLITEARDMLVAHAAQSEIMGMIGSAGAVRAEVRNDMRAQLAASLAEQLGWSNQGLSLERQLSELSWLYEGMQLDSTHTGSENGSDQNS